MKQVTFKIYWLCLFLLWTTLSFSQEKSHELNRMMRFQGKLSNEQITNVVSDAVSSMTFRLYEYPVGGTALWDETHNEVALTSGVFNVMLGSKANFDTMADSKPTTFGFYWPTFEKTVYLALSVDNAPEIKPRWLITPAVYAFDALHARVADRGPELAPVAFLEATNLTSATALLVYTSTGNEIEYDTGLSYQPSSTYDAATPESHTDTRGTLEYKWDLFGEGNWDQLEWEEVQTVDDNIKTATYNNAGTYLATVRVRKKDDTSGRIGEARILVIVK